MMPHDSITGIPIKATDMLVILQIECVQSQKLSHKVSLWIEIRDHLPGVLLRHWEHLLPVTVSVTHWHCPVIVSQVLLDIAPLISQSQAVNITISEYCITSHQYLINTNQRPYLGISYFSKPSIQVILIPAVLEAWAICKNEWVLNWPS